MVQLILARHDCQFSVHGHPSVKCGNTSPVLDGKMGGEKQKQDKWENRVEGKSCSEVFKYF